MNIHIIRNRTGEDYGDARLSRQVMGCEVVIAVTGGTLDFARIGDPANGKSIAFSGDTDVCKGLVEAARDANLAVFESSFPDGQKAVGHLTPGEAGEIASRSNAERLLLTHFYPECEGEDIFVQCRNRYAGEILLAEDLLRISV